MVSILAYLSFAYDMLSLEILHDSSLSIDVLMLLMHNLPLPSKSEMFESSVKHT